MELNTFIQPEIIKKAQKGGWHYCSRSFVIKKENQYAVVSFNLLERILNFFTNLYMERCLEKKFKSKNFKVLINQDLQRLSQKALKTFPPAKENVTSNPKATKEPSSSDALPKEKEISSPDTPPREFWSSLPQDVKSHIFSYLHPFNIRKTGLVSKDFQKLSDLRKIDYINKNKVDFHALPISPQGVTTLLKRHGEKLKYFKIRDAKYIELIQNCPNLKHLYFLHWREDFIIPLTSAHFLQLQRLEFESVDISDKNFEKIIELLNNFTKLEELKLININNINNGFQKLVAVPYFSNLRILDLSCSDINDESLEKFAASTHFPNVQILNLIETKISDKGLEKLVASPHFKLKVLNLKGVNITDEGLEKLAASPYLSNLESLKLGSYSIFRISELSHEGFKKLAESPNFNNLQTLDVTRCINEYALVRMFANSPNFPKLKTIYLNSSPAVMEDLRKQYPLLQILESPGPFS